MNSFLLLVTPVIGPVIKKAARNFAVWEEPCLTVLHLISLWLCRGSLVKKCLFSQAVPLPHHTVVYHGRHNKGIVDLLASA
jgi:hypothetical protein